MLSTAGRTTARLLARQTCLRRTCRKRTLSHFQSGESVEETDIVIVGGGPVGLALAAALGSQNSIRESLKITLVEAGDLSKVRDWTLQPDEFSNRVSSITNRSRTFLQDIGVWDQVDEARTAPIVQMQVWDGISDARITFDASEYSLEDIASPPSSSSSEMARMTENLNLQRALIQRLSHFESIQLLDNVRVSSILQDDTEVSTARPLIHLSNGRTLRTQLLVGADGINSPVRAYAGISSYGWAYDTHAIVATLNHAPRGALQPPNNAAYQRFLPTGPIAFLPLSETASSLVWSTKPSLAAVLRQIDPSALASMINAAFRLPHISINYLHKFILEVQRAGKSLAHEDLLAEISWREKSHAILHHSAYSSMPSTVSEMGVPPHDADVLPPLVESIQPETVASFPLRYNHAESYIGEGANSRTVLVGDAAHTIHPLAGQGLNLGLGDVESLTRCIGQALLYGGDIGSYTALLPYTRERYFENHKVMSATDKLHKLYSSTLAPLVWARSVGLEVLNELDSVKAALMINAGSGSRHVSPDFGGAGWRLAARGAETLAGSASLLQQIAGGIRGAVEPQLDTLFKGVSSHNNKRH